MPKPTDKRHIFDVKISCYLRLDATGNSLYHCYVKSFPRFVLIASIIAICSSATLYGLHFLIFHDVSNSLNLLLGDLAYLPLEVLLVVVIIERVLSQRERQNVLLKLNMIIGAFFGEVGNKLLVELTPLFNECRHELNEHLGLTADWDDSDFHSAMRYIQSEKLKPTCNLPDLKRLGEFLSNKRAFLLQLLQNPYVLEHETFSDVLLSIDHLDDELEARAQFPELPENDIEHLEGDIGRFYGHLVYEFLVYAQHLQKNYPFLYSLIVRTHPFQSQPKAVVET